jgi:phage shock protein E
MGLLSRIFGAPAAEADFAALMANGAKIIDVRTEGEFKSGALRDSINIPLDTMQGQVKKVKGYKKVIILVCRSGARASSAKSILSKAGVEVYNAGAWQNLK